MPDEPRSERRQPATVPVNILTPRIVNTVASRRERKSRLLPYLALVTVIAAAGAGVLWRLQATQRSPLATPVASTGATPPDGAVSTMPDTTSTTPADSTAPPVARADSTAVAHPVDSQPRPRSTPDSATVSAPADDTTTPAASARKPPPPSNLPRLLRPIRADIAVGTARLEEGEYEGAIVRLRSAAERLASLDRRYPDTQAIVSLQREVRRHLEATRDACEAEREVALERGEPAPDCQ